MYNVTKSSPIGSADILQGLQNPTYLLSFPDPACAIESGDERLDVNLYAYALFWAQIYLSLPSLPSLPSLLSLLSLHSPPLNLSPPSPPSAPLPSISLVSLLSLPSISPLPPVPPLPSPQSLPSLPSLRSPPLNLSSPSYPSPQSLPSLIPAQYSWPMSQVPQYSVRKKGTPTSSGPFPLNQESNVLRELSSDTLSGPRWHTLLRTNTFSPM